MSIKKSQAILKRFIDLKFGVWFTLGTAGLVTHTPSPLPDWTNMYDVCLINSNDAIYSDGESSSYLCKISYTQLQFAI